MTFYNPVQRSPMPFFHQTASSVSPRDNDATGRQYRKNMTIGQQVQANSNAIKLIQDYIGRQRRRIVGGGSAAGTSGWHKPLNGKYEVDPTYGYDEGSVIHIQSGNALVTTGIRDAAAPTGPLVISKSGFWVSTQAVPPQATVSAHLVWNLPQFPLPVPTNLDDATNFWIYLGDIYC